MFWQIKLAISLLVLASLFGAYKYVRHDAVSDYKVEIALEQAEADKAQQDKYNKLAGDYETLKNRRAKATNTITREIETIVRQPIYQTQCVDQAGVDAANKALRGDLE